MLRNLDLLCDIAFKDSGKGHAIMKKVLKFFFSTVKVQTVIKLDGGGGYGLNCTAIKKKTFYAAFL